MQTRQTNIDEILEKFGQYFKAILLSISVLESKVNQIENRLNKLEDSNSNKFFIRR